MTRPWLYEWGTQRSSRLWGDLPRGHHRPCCWLRALEGLENRTLLSTILVNNSGDHGSGTLRDAINQAELHPGSTIEFRITGPITLSSALPHLSADMTISGPGATVLIVQRSSAPGTPQFGIFAVDVGVRATISGLTIAGGNAINGGGIANAGTLTIRDCTLSRDSATNGGGLANFGTLTILNSTLSGDTATESSSVEAAAAAAAAAVSAAATATTPAALAAAAAAAALAIGGNGGGLVNFGAMTLDHCTLSRDSATNGGGLANAGTLTVNNSILSGDAATEGGAAIVAAVVAAADAAAAAVATPAADVAVATVTAAAVGGSGGGLANAGTLTVNNSILSGNTSTNGGGIDNVGTLTVNNSILSGNTAMSSGAAVVPPSVAAVIAAAVIGGGGAGILNAGTLTITNSALSGNTATSGVGTGLANFGTLTVTAGLSTLREALGDSGSGLFNMTSASGPVIPQSISSSVSIALSAVTVAPFAGAIAPAAGIGASFTSPVAPPTSPVGSFTDTGETSTDPGKAFPAPGALAAAIGALAAAPGASVARLVPLRESALALVGTLLVLTLDSSTEDDTRNSSAIDLTPTVPVGPWPTTRMDGSLPSTTSATPTGRGGTEDGGYPAATAQFVPQGPAPWELFVIGLDEDFDQFRREFRAPQRDGADPKKKVEEAPTPWNQPMALRLTAARPLDHREQDRPATLPPRANSWATDEAIDSQWSEDTASAYPLQSGSGTMASPVLDIPATSDTMSDAPAPIGPIRRGGDSLLELSDPEGTSPLPVSLSTVALGLVAGCAWLRRRRRERPV
jgi:hypothetical protein